MPSGQFEFDINTSPSFDIDELGKWKQRALKESGATRQFYALSGAVFRLLPTYKVDAVFMLGLAVLEFAVHVMRHRAKAGA